MKILRRDVKGYRSLRDVSWTPGDLNVLIGPNGAGKSNLLRMLELISVSTQGGLGKYVQRLGGMDPLVWDGAAEAISFGIKASPVDKSRSVEKDSLTYKVAMDRIGKSSAYRIGYELLANFYRVVAVERNRDHPLTANRIVHLAESMSFPGDPEAEHAAKDVMQAEIDRFKKLALLREGYKGDARERIYENMPFSVAHEIVSQVIHKIVSDGSFLDIPL